MLTSLDLLLKNITSAKSANTFKKYIDFIQFPFYRNLEINTRINFIFPLTVFIGQNGCGKSSALHALYGSVLNKTPSEFWFDTKLDPIKYYDDAKRRHSFWYSFRERNEERQVVKARIKRKDDPNYWETSRPLVWAGMDKSMSRNKPLMKDVLYLDFRGELSAFDKFFYFGDTKGSKAKNKQEFIRTKSVSLNNIFEGNKLLINSSKRPLNDPMEILTSAELESISYILGRNYKSGKSVKHSIFRNEGYSVLFETEYALYSEAFAGSGEMAVVRLVKEVLKANDYSLILLDEPEVSLHPGAQERLKIFLLNQILIKKHQIIITSHSPSIARALPAESLKVFYQNPQNGRFLVTENLLPEEAFFHIEFPIEVPKKFIVEDKLAKDIIDSTIKSLGQATANLFNVKFNPGGESVIKKEFISVFCRSPNSKDYVIFDGDQKINEVHYDWKSFPVDSITETFLRQKIKEQTNEEIKFSVDGENGVSNKDQKVALLKQYLDYYNKNVFYLPGKIPEDVIWDAEKASQLIGISIVDPEELKAIEIDLNQINSAKLKFAKVADIVMGNSTNESITSIHKIFIQAWILKENSEFREVKNIILQIKK